MRVTVIVATHLPKGTALDTSYWKLGARLDPSKIGVSKAVAADLARIKPTRCFHSEGFVRTEESVKLLTGMESTSCFEISPYASHNDSDWWSVDPKGDKPANQLIVEHPDFCKKIGRIGGDAIRRHVAGALDGDVLLFMTHCSVAEPVVDDLLKYSGMSRTVKDFGKGDLTVVEYEDGKVISVAYIAAPKAA